MRIRRLETAIRDVQAFVEVWLKYGKLIDGARKKGAVSAADEEEFARVTQELVRHYRSSLRLLENARLPGHHVIWRSLQSGTLAGIVGMPDAPFVKYWQDWQGGYRTLQEFLAFLQTSRLDLLEMPRWRYYLQILTNSRPVKAAAIALVLGIGLWVLVQTGVFDFATQKARGIAAAQVVGQVEVKGAGKTQWRPLLKGEQVVRGDTVRCGPGAFVDLMSDSATTLRIEAGSEVAIERSLLSRLTSFHTLVLRLLHGRVYVLAKATRSGRDVRVCTSEGMSRIGEQETRAAISHTEEGGTSSSVYDGEVEVVSALQRALILHAKERAQIRQQQLDEAAQSVPDEELDRAKAMAAAIGGDVAQLVETTHLRAKELQDHGKEREASAAYKKVITLDPSHALAHLGYQDVGVEMGKRYSLIDEYRQLADASPHSAVLQWAYGRIALEPRERRKRAEKALSLAKGLYWGHLLMGDVLLGDRKYDDAVAAYKQGIALEAALPHGHCRLAAVYRLMGRRDEALAETQALAQAHPDSPEVWCEVAELYTSLAMYPEADKAAKRSLARDPLGVRAHGILGSVNTKDSEGKYLDRQVAWCEKALALDPDNFAARVKLLSSWHLRWRVGVTPKTLEHARQLLADWPASYRAYETVGALYYQIRYSSPSADISALGIEEPEYGERAEKALRRAKELEPRATSARCLLADLHTARRDFSKALAELKEVASLEPWSGAAQVKMGSLYYAMGSDFYASEREQAYREALKRDPYTGQAYAGLISVCRSRGDEAQARELGVEWLKRDPYSRGALSEAHRFWRSVAKDSAKAEEVLTRREPVDPYYVGLHRISCLNAEKQYDGAIAAAESFLARQPVSSAVAILATALRGKGDAEGALTRLRAYQQLLPKAVSPYIQIARECRAQKRDQEALDAYLTAVRMNPYNKTVRRELAAQQKKMGKLGDARATTEGSLALCHDPYDNVRMAALFEAQKDYAQVERWAKRACAEGCLLAYNWLARFYERRGKAEGDLKTYNGLAINTYNELLKLHPNSARAWRGYGDLLHHRLKDSRGATGAYRKAVELEPNEFHAWHGLGLACGKSSAEAVEAFGQAIKLRPFHGRARYEYAYRLLDQGHPGEAIPHFTKAYQLWNNVACLYWRTGAYVKLKDRDGMLKSAKEAVAARPEYPLGYIWLGRVYDEGLSDAHRAVEAYERALALGVQGSAKASIEQRLPQLKAIVAQAEERKRMAPYAKFLASVRDEVAQFDIEEALGLCDQAAGNPGLKAFAAEVKQEREDVVSMSRFLRSAWQGAAGTKQKLRLRNGTSIVGDIEALDGLRMKVQFASGVTKNLHLRDVSVDQIIETGLRDVEANARLLRSAECRYYMGEFLQAFEEVQNVAAPGPEVDRLKRKLTWTQATVHIDSIPPGATVSIDGVRQGTTPFHSEFIPAGQREIAVVKASMGRWSETVDLAPGGTFSKTSELLDSLTPGFRDSFDTAGDLSPHWRASTYTATGPAAPQRREPSGYTAQIADGCLRIRGKGTAPWGGYHAFKALRPNIALVEVRVKFLKWSKDSSAGISIGPCPNCAFFNRHFDGKWKYHRHPCKPGEAWLIGEAAAAADQEWHRLRLIYDRASATLFAYLDSQLLGQMSDYKFAKRWRGDAGLLVTARRGAEADVLLDDFRVFKY